MTMTSDKSFTAAPARRELVVFVSDTPSSRLFKMSYGLKSHGCRTILLHKNPLDVADAAPYVDESYRYSDVHEALHLASGFRPLAYHVFSSWNFDTAYHFMKNKPGKIVFDDYDIMAGVTRPDFAARNYPNFLELERFCLEQADGLSCRDLLLQQAKRVLHYSIKGKRIYLPDGCWNHYGHLSDERRTDRSELHVAYVGNLAIEKFSGVAHPRDNFYFLDLAKDLASAGIHFHLYPSPAPHFVNNFENVLSEHLEFADRTRFYHVHRPLPVDALIPELSRYDLGLQSMWPGATHTNKAYDPVVFSDSTANKLFDYMDAGIGVISCESLKFQRWFLGKEGICLSAHLDEVKNTILAAPDTFWDGLKDRVRGARERYAVTVQAKRLIEFYKELNLPEGQRVQAGRRARSTRDNGFHLSQAYNFFRAGDLTRSAREVDRELQLHPGNEDARHFSKTLRIMALKG